jgi:hypothetical protein
LRISRKVDTEVFRVLPTLSHDFVRRDSLWPGSSNDGEFAKRSARRRRYDEFRAGFLYEPSERPAFTTTATENFCL